MINTLEFAIASKTTNKVFPQRLFNDYQKACEYRDKRPDPNHWKIVYREYTEWYDYPNPKDYKFEAEFIDTTNDLVQIHCTDGIYNYEILIHTYSDPYTCFYSNGYTPANKDEFEHLMFKYLSEKFPEHF